MTDKTYSPYKLAIELGFSEALAKHYEELDLDATKLRQIARAKDMPSSKPKLGKPETTINVNEPIPDDAPVILVDEEVVKGIADKLDKALIKPLHRHSYRKDGTCRCGAVRKAKK